MTPLNDGIDECHLNSKELMMGAEAQVQVATGASYTAVEGYCQGCSKEVLAVQCDGADLNEQDPLRLQLQTHAVAAVVQEVLQPQELEATQSSPVPPVHSHLQLPGLAGSKHQVKHIQSGPASSNAR